LKEVKQKFGELALRSGDVIYWRLLVGRGSMKQHQELILVNTPVLVSGFLNRLIERA
jgi:hypothetical protein